MPVSSPHLQNVAPVTSEAGICFWAPLHVCYVNEQLSASFQNRVCQILSPPDLVNVHPTLLSPLILVRSRGGEVNFPTQPAVVVYRGITLRLFKDL